MAPPLVTSIPFSMLPLMRELSSGEGRRTVCASASRLFSSTAWSMRNSCCAVNALKKSSKVAKPPFSMLPVVGPRSQFIAGWRPLLSAISSAATMFIRIDPVCPMCLPQRVGSTQPVAAQSRMSEISEPCGLSAAKTFSSLCMEGVAAVI